MLRDIPTRALLIAGFLAAGLLPVMVVALLSLSAGKAELKHQAFAQLESVRNIKRGQIESFFEQRARIVTLLASDPYLADAFAELSGAFHAQGGAAGGHFAGHDHGQFEAPPSYRAVHDRHAAFFARYVDALGFYDLLLVEAGGETCFSVKKESDFAAVAGSSLREVWEGALRERRAVLSDTRPYAPSRDAAAQFVAAPVMRDGVLLGVVALQISLDSIDAIMRERSGMGQTGETYLVGPDRKMRSDSRRDPARTVEASFRGDVAHNGVDTEATRRALAAEAGAAGVQEFTGKTVLAAYAPVDVLGTRWAIVAVIDQDEIDAQISRALNPKIAAVLLGSCAVVVALALLVSLAITRGIRGIVSEVGRLSARVLEGKLGARGAPDAVGRDFRVVVAQINGLIDAFVVQLDSVPAPVVIVDPALRVGFVNRAGAALAGVSREAAVGQPCCEVFGFARCSGADCLARQAMAERRPVSGETTFVRDGRRLDLLVTASPLGRPGAEPAGGLEVIVDRTEARRVAEDKRKLEERVGRMQRLEAVATLAGGIAHDFNNILTYLYAYADIAEGMLEPTHPAKAPLGQIGVGITRASELVKQILVFSRKVTSERAPLDLVPLVKESAKLVQASLPPTIRLMVKTPAGPLPVLAEPTQAHQVVSNLLTNAHHAMLEGGGELGVELSARVLPEAREPDDVPLPPGRYVVLRVADTGHGMDELTQARVFEPFFTTKPVGQGTGMGLALVHGIVTAYGGAIRLESAPGKGSSFEVLLPLVELESAGSELPSHAPGAPRVLAPGARRGRILFVDDEERICQVGAQMLDSLGYDVTTHLSGRAAIEELRSSPGQYDALVTDLLMPDMDGRALSREALAVHPELPIVLTTGQREQPTPEQLDAEGIDALLVKPYRKSDLARVLGELLA